MKLENCPKCSKELIFLQSSSRHICRTCGAINQQKNEETEQFKDSEVTSSPEIVVKSEVIPVEIEVVDSQFNKSMGWSAAGLAAGALIAGPVGAIIGLATQGNGQKFHYIIKFSDGTQQVVVCDEKKLQLDLIIWSWRINEKKTEKDYVTFGVDFSKLERDMIIPKSVIDKKLGLGEKQAGGFGEAWQMIELEQKLIKFLKSEIQRYFNEQKNDVVILEETAKGLKIPFKASDTLYKASDTSYGIFGLVVLIFIFGSCVASMTSPEPSYNSNSSSEAEYNSSSKFDPDDPEYIKSVIDRSGVGQTIDSVQEMVNACVVMLQDQGMTYSQAYDRCN